MPFNINLPSWHIYTFTYKSQIWQPFIELIKVPNSLMQTNHLTISMLSFQDSNIKMTTYYAKIDST